MFQFPAFAPIKNIWVTIIQTVRLSHSEILGSKIICIYPRLIAAYHVLHRLREPRHPPYALNYFLFIFIYYQTNNINTNGSIFMLILSAVF